MQGRVCPLYARIPLLNLTDEGGGEEVLQPGSSKKKFFSPKLYIEPQIDTDYSEKTTFKINSANC